MRAPDCRVQRPVRRRSSSFAVTVLTCFLGTKSQSRELSEEGYRFLRVTRPVARSGTLLEVCRGGGSLWFGESL